jgi:lambda family phage minor tail protein L
MSNLPLLGEIQSLSPDVVVELFVMDLTKFGVGEVLRFHSGVNEMSMPVVWQGNTYIALPIEAEGFDVSSKGTLPRPRIRVANIGGMFSSAVRESDDLIGCWITRKRTFAKYLDAVNFPGGDNIYADPNQHFPDGLWIVEQKISENKYMLEWELSSAFDVQGVKLPFRQVVQNSCGWDYKSSECGYSGTSYFDSNDESCLVAADYCSKRLKACKLRFGNAVLPYGAFPGAMRYAY